MSEQCSDFRGRGAQINPVNRFAKEETDNFFSEISDEPFLQNDPTEYITVRPKSVLNRVDSPDLMNLSMNPYQGCEHGCVYCYARNTHEYWGYSAGLDFERKILVKENAAELLVKELSSPKHIPDPVMLSGNTDCYQPIERKLGITRKMLEVMLRFKHPVGIVTKNALVLRDIDILTELAGMNLVSVMISITGSDEKLREKLEPRTSSYRNRFLALEKLSSAGIRTGVLFGPVIPGLNSHEIPEVLKRAADAGVQSAGYNMLRLNGQVGDIFLDWLNRNYPDRKDKVWHHTESAHGGKVNDSRFGVRMTGEGPMTDSIRKLFELHCDKLGLNKKKMNWNTSSFDRRAGDSQLRLF